MSTLLFNTYCVNKIQEFYDKKMLKNKYDILNKKIPVGSFYHKWLEQSLFVGEGTAKSGTRGSQNFKNCSMSFWNKLFLESQS